MEIYPILGIDLGTCYSCVYAYTNGQLSPVSIFGANSIRSAIYIKDNEMLFGSMAMAHIRSDPENVFYDIKRFIGRTYNEVSDIVHRKNYQFTVMQYGSNPLFVVPSDINGNNYQISSAEVLDSHFLKFLVTEAERALQYQIKAVVITVPAFFQESQIYTTMQAANYAGLNVLAMFHEPSAAALASNLPPVMEKRHILVYDLGGGTFDLALVETENASYDVIGSDGDAFLGGSDFDMEMCRILVDNISSQGIDVSQWNRRKISKLQEMAETAKIVLSTQEMVNVDISLIDDELTDFIVYRRQFNDAIQPYIQRTLDICHRLLAQTRITLNKGDAILLVGGSSYIPLVRASLEHAFPEVPIENNVNPAEIVAQGAAWYCLDLYCSQHKIPNPLPCPVIHPIVVHSVYVQFNDEDPLLVLPSGVRCQTLMSITHRFGWNGKVKVTILTEGDNHQSNERRVLDTFHIRGFFGEAIIEMLMNIRGELEFSYGLRGHGLSTKVVGFQHNISHDELSQFTRRYNLLENCKKDMTSIYNRKVREERLDNVAKDQYKQIMNWFNNPQVMKHADENTITRVFQDNYNYLNSF